MICFRKNLFLWFALAMAFYSSAWGGCSTTNWVVTKSTNGGVSCAGFPQCGQSTVSFSDCGNGIGGGSCTTGSGGTCTQSFCKSQLGANTLCNSRNTWYNVTTICCGNECEADSVQNGGFILECQFDVVQNKYYRWICPGDLNCSSCGQQFYSDQSQCEQAFCQDNPDSPNCTNSTVCDLARSRCAKLGGQFSSSIINNECSSTCNTCGNAANKKILKIKAESCCAQNLAPSVDKMCQTTIQSGVGETYSTNANLECRDPSLSEEGASAYAEYCSGDYDWDEESSSSGEGGSSSSGEGTSGEGGSSSSGEGTSEGTSAGTSEGLEGGDYYPILDTIRDTLNDIRDNVENIYLCLVTPSACAGLSSGKSGDTVIVNVPSDSVILKDIKSGILKLDTSSNKTIAAIGVANDTLIDSMRKYLGEVSSALGEINLGFSGDTLGDSLGRIHGTLEEIKGLLDGEEVDTSGVGSSWGVYIEEGERIGDSIGVASGWIGGLDTVDVDSVFASASAAASDSVKYDSLANEVDSALQHRLDSLYNRMKLSVDSSRSSLIDSMGVWAETLKVYAPFADFDSLIYNAIGAKIPNSDECPDNCQKWSLSLPRFGLINYTVDFGLCLGRSPLGGTSVLGFIRLLVRLVVVWTCIWFVIWNFTKRKGS